MVPSRAPPFAPHAVVALHPRSAELLPGDTTPGPPALRARACAPALRPPLPLREQEHLATDGMGRLTAPAIPPVRAPLEQAGQQPLVAPISRIVREKYERLSHPILTKGSPDRWRIEASVSRDKN
jgi:hypothetical protein